MCSGIILKFQTSWPDILFKFLILQFHNKTNISPYREEYKIRANSNECPAKGKCIGTGLVKKILLKEYILGSAIKNLGLFSKSPGDFKMETMDF